MSLTPMLYPQEPPNEINEFELSKTPSMVYSPVIHPEDSFGIPSPLNLSERNNFSLSDKNGNDYPLSDDEISKPKKFNFKYVESVHYRKLSNENLKSNFNKKKEEKFFHNGKKYSKDNSDDDEFVLEANELDSDNEEEKICPQNDADNEEDDEENLGILRILRNQKGKI